MTQLSKDRVAVCDNQVSTWTGPIMYLSKLHKLKISIAYLIVLLLSTKITVLEKSFLLKHISKCGRQTVHIHYIFLW